MKNIDNKRFRNHQYPRRGEIYYVTDPNAKDGKYSSFGAEMHSNRFAVIVSSNVQNKNSDVVQIIYLTTSRNKKPCIYHVDVSRGDIFAVALCEQVTSVDKSRILEYKAYLKAEKMKEVTEAIMHTLGIIKSIPTRHTRDRMPICI